jgi:hypothetical protein
VTRYITLESELQATQDRLSSAETRLAKAEKDLLQAEDDLRRYEIEGALDEEAMLDRLYEAAREGSSVGVPEVRGLADLNRFSDEQVAPVLDAWKREAEKVIAQTDLWNSIPTGESSLDPWSEFRRGRQLPISVEQVWAGFYDKVAEALEELARKQETFRLLTVSNRIISSSSVYNTQDRNRLRGIVDEAREQADRQRVETAAARDARSRISRPPGLAAGLVVLALLTVANVVVPVLFLVPTPATLSYGGELRSSPHSSRPS